MEIVTGLLYLFSLGGFLTQVFIYPDYLQRFIGFHPIWLLAAFIISTIFTKSNKTLQWLYALNKIVITPVSLLAVLLFSWLEATHYQNYVLTTFHIHHVNLGLIFALGYLTFLISQGRKALQQNYQRYIFLTSAVLIIIFLVFSTGDRVYITYLAREDGIWESMQFILFAFSGVVTSIASLVLNKHSKWHRIIYFLFGLGLLFIAMEEISWGQRYFGIQTPDTLKELNVQQEVNLHNLPLIHNNRDWAYIAIGLYGSFAWVVSKKPSRLFIPPNYLFLCFFSVVVYYGMYSHLVGTYHAFSEFSELMLTLGIAIFVMVNLKPASFQS